MRIKGPRKKLVCQACLHRVRLLYLYCCCVFLLWLLIFVSDPKCLLALLFQVSPAYLFYSFQEHKYPRRDFTMPLARYVLSQVTPSTFVSTGRHLAATFDTTPSVLLRNQAPALASFLSIYKYGSLSLFTLLSFWSLFLHYFSGRGLQKKQCFSYFYVYDVW